jgi:hypothetical protein
MNFCVWQGKPEQLSGKAPNLSLEATRLRRDVIASDWATTLITHRGRQAWAAARLSSDRYAADAYLNPVICEGQHLL